jgi:hypothetical protein
MQPVPLRFNSTLSSHPIQYLWIGLLLRRNAIQNGVSPWEALNNYRNIHLVNNVVKHPVRVNKWGEARGRWLVSYRDWFSFSDCCFCCYIGRNVVEAVTDGDLIEWIYHRCRDGRSASFMDYNLHVSRCYLAVPTDKAAWLLDFIFTVYLRSSYNLMFHLKEYEW